jgi:hypothetical protein
VVDVLSSVDESVSGSGLDARRLGRWLRRVVGKISNSAGWPDFCKLLLVLLVRSGVRVEGCRDSVGSLDKEERCRCQKKSGRLPGLVAYTKLK